MYLVIAAGLIEAALVCLVNMAGSVVESILLLLLVQPVYLFAVHRVFTRSGCKPWFIIAAGVVFRITVITLPSPFTDDLTRYRWEARVHQAGLNPYESRPSDPQLQRFRDSTSDRIPAPEFRAAYGPAWELLGSWTLRLTGSWARTPQSQLMWMKLPAIAFDLGAIGALLLLLKFRNIPSDRVLVYAWSPLAVWEFWANGHNDAVVLFFMIAALAAIAKSPRNWRGGALLGVAIATKWWPAILLPAITRHTWSIRPILLSGAVLAVFALPFLTDVTENAQFMTGFVGGWRNNDSLFGFLLYLTSGALYHAKYLAFTLMGLMALWLATRDWPLERIALWTIVTMLLLSANCHPWYLTWIVPFLAIFPHPSLLLWVGLIPLAYESQIAWQISGIWEGSPTSRWCVYVPVFIMMTWESARAVQRGLRNNAEMPSERRFVLENAKAPDIIVDE